MEQDWNAELDSPVPQKFSQGGSLDSFLTPLHYSKYFFLACDANIEIERDGLQ